MINDENKRRSAGCHMTLTVPPLPNVGVTRADRPHIAWLYRSLVEQHGSGDIVFVLESLPGVLDIMEALSARADLLESLNAGGDLVEAVHGSVQTLAALAAGSDVLETLAATIIVNPT